MNTKLPIPLYVCVSLIVVLSGCRAPADTSHDSLTDALPTASAATRLQNAASEPAPAVPAIDLQRVKPNEAGRIPILMYHAIGAPPLHGVRYDRLGLNISPNTFRKQLSLMYAAGWYPVNMRDVLNAHINVPPGKIPVVITFDDSRGTQFCYRKDGTIDPDCAVAILEAFHDEHPDWPLRATFYVLPASKWNPAPFYQSKLATRKLRYLVEKGLEVANHSTTHRSMRSMDARTLQWEMAECVRYVKTRAPNATMDTMALPYGSAPRNPALWNCLLNGREGGITYHNRCILMAWGGPAYPPTHKQFDLRRITRMGSEPGYIEMWIRQLHSGRPLRPYVSDGDPQTVTVPRSARNEVDIHRLDGARLVVYDDSPKKRSRDMKPANANIHRPDSAPAAVKPENASGHHQ